MKNYIYCKTSAKGDQSFYLRAQDKCYFLFIQPYRKSNKEVFEQGVSLFDLKRLRKHHSTSVIHTAEKIPAYIHYVEQEYGVSVMESTKRKQSNYKPIKMKENCWRDDWEVA